MCFKSLYVYQMLILLKRLVNITFEDITGPLKKKQQHNQALTETPGLDQEGLTLETEETSNRL